MSGKKSLAEPEPESIKSSKDSDSKQELASASINKDNQFSNNKDSLPAASEEIGEEIEEQSDDSGDDKAPNKESSAQKGEDPEERSIKELRLEQL